MADEYELKRQSDAQIAEKASLVWRIADNALRGLYKPAEYGRVFLPMTVVKRFHDCLAPTHEKVQQVAKQTAGLDVRDGFLKRASGYDFYNTSGFTWAKLIGDPNGIEENFIEYLHGFSENVQDILFQSGMKFDNEIRTMADNGVLFQVIKDFGTAKADFSPDKFTEVEMGGIFENLVSRFSETDEAGEHFTSRDIVYLMTDLVISADPRVFEGDHIRRLVYDGSMGTSQMLSCMRERLQSLDSEAGVTTFGQELNPFTFAIAKASALIRGEDADNMRRGNTYDNDQFKGYQFDYVIQNPPFGISFAAQQEAIKTEHKKGTSGRFPCELPSVSDGQTLFALNGLAKLKDNGIMAIVQDASPMYKGNPGKGEDDYRRYILENDWLDAIVQLSTESFVNTGIATYIWLFDKNKPEGHRGKVLLIDASGDAIKRRRAIGDKKNDLTKVCRNLITHAYGSWRNGSWSDNAEDGSAVTVEARLFDTTDFGFNRITVYTPERDEGGRIVYDRKHNPKAALDPDGKKISDTEDVPMNVDIDDYMAKEVEPFNPGAWYDKKKIQEGYSIPFTSAFYRYHDLEPSQDIAARILEHVSTLQKKLGALFNEVK